MYHDPPAGIQLPEGYSVTPELTGKVLALGCALAWAIAVILFKQSGETVRPLALNLYKCIVGLILFIPVIIWFEKSIVPPEIALRDFWVLSLSGIIGITVADTLFFKCLNLIGAGLTAIVDCLYSPFMMLTAYWMLGESAGTREIIGAGLVITAILIATVQPRTRNRSSRNPVLGIAVGAMGMFAMALSVVLMKPCFPRVPVLWITEIRLLAATAILFLQLSLHRDRKTMTRSLLQSANWRHAFPGTLFGNVIAMLMWITAFKLTEISITSVLNQTSTMFIVILATLFLKEPLTLRKTVAMTLAFAGAVTVILG